MKISVSGVKHGDKICLCSNDEMLAQCKQVFVCHANIVHFVNTLDFVTLSEYLTFIWGWYQVEVTLNINNHNSIG